MTFYQAPLWSVQLPDGWETESVEDGVLFSRGETGEGELLVSCLESPEGPVTEEDVMELAEEQIDEELPVQEVVLGPLRGLLFEHEAEGVQWREWFLMLDQLLIYATYACGVEERGAEDAAVEALLASLRPRRH